MSDIEIYDADQALMEKAAAGPHRDWESISIELEGARFQMLHDIVSCEIFDLDDEIKSVDIVHELAELARSKGYADADTYANITASMSQDEIERDAVVLNLKHLLDNPDQGDYFSLVRNSEQVLLDSTQTGSARNFLTQEGDNRPGLIFSSMLGAYEDGRNARLNVENANTFAR